MGVPSARFFSTATTDMPSPWHRTVSVFCLLFAAAGVARAQGDIRTPSPERFFILMQGYAAPNLSATGLSTTFGVGVADMGGSNPAALGAVNRPTVGLTYQLESSISDGYFASIGYDPMNGARPQSAGTAVPLGAWVLGASYAQRYAAEMDFGPVPSPTQGNPEIDPVLTSEVRQFARLETVAPHVAYRATLTSGANLAVGARLGVGRVAFESLVDDETTSISDWGTQFAVGVSYRVPDGYGLAAYYESQLRVSGQTDRVVRLPSNGETRSVTVPFADAIPARFGLSVEAEARPDLRLGADVAWVRWKAAWEEDSDQLKDQPELSVWAQRDLSAEALVSFGVMYRGRNRWDNGVDEAFDYSGRAVYLTAGGALTVGSLRLDMVVADSRLLSSENHRQTVVKVGASVEL